MSLASLVVARSLRYVTLSYVTLRCIASYVTLHSSHSVQNFAVADFTRSLSTFHMSSRFLTLSLSLSPSLCLCLWVGFKKCVSVRLLIEANSPLWLRLHLLFLSFSVSPYYIPLLLSSTTTSSRRRLATLPLINHSLNTKHSKHNKLNNIQ